MGGEAKRRMRWAEQLGEFGWVVKENTIAVILQAGDPEKEIHVMPARKTPTFQDPNTARDYTLQLKKAGDPVLLFGDGPQEHLWAHWGHKPDRDCVCEPRTERRREAVIYTHNQPT